MTSLRDRVSAGDLSIGEAARLDVEAFDRLPGRLKQFVREAQVEIVADDAERVLRECGGDEVRALASLRYYVELVKRKSPIVAAAKPSEVTY